MASFEANPNELSEPWIERKALDGYGFRNWHLMFFCFSGFIALLVLICCCVKFRIPRTKLEIEGDYRRKKLAKKFQEKLGLIQNQDIDALDLQQALKIIQEDFEQENSKIQNQLVLEGCQNDNIELGGQTPELNLQQTKFAKKFADIMFAAKAPPIENEV